MHIGYIGLGKMGSNMVSRLLEKGHEVTAFDVDADARKKAEEAGATSVENIEELVRSLSEPRTVWIMVPHKVVDSVLEELRPHLSAGDTVIEGGNSPYTDSMQRAEDLLNDDIHFLDVGVSGGPHGAREGACMMIGGEKEVYEKHESLFADLTVENGHGYMGKNGAGHFVKMVHNGIEYGMMQAIAEGFHVMKEADFDLDLEKVARVYNNGSVVESRLMEWTEKAFKEQGNELANISGAVDQSGEGKWTSEEAEKRNIPAPVIDAAVAFRTHSQDDPNFAGKVVSALRNQFGGHDVFIDGREEK